MSLILPRSTNFNSYAMHWPHLIWIFFLLLFPPYPRSVHFLLFCFVHKTKFPMMIVALNFQYTHYICTICSLSIHPLLAYMLLVLLLLLFVSSFWSSFSLDTHTSTIIKIPILCTIPHIVMHSVHMCDGSYFFSYLLPPHFHFIYSYTLCIFRQVYNIFFFHHFFSDSIPIRGPVCMFTVLMCAYV